MKQGLPIPQPYSPFGGVYESAPFRIAAVIRRHFRELDEFREAMAGRSITVRIGTQGSVIDWLLAPGLGAIREVLGNAVIEMEQQRTLDVVRAVSDGLLDFGIVREDAMTPGTRSWPLGKVGYSVFTAKALWKGCAGVQELFGRVPVAELLPGGQFSTRCNEWRERKGLQPQITARVASFTDLARVVRAGHAPPCCPTLRWWTSIPSRSTTKESRNSKRAA